MQIEFLQDLLGIGFSIPNDNAIYGTAKVHKLSTNDTVEELARYLAKALSPLSRSQYTVESSNKFLNVIKQ